MFHPLLDRRVTAAAGRRHLQIRNAQQPLQRPLVNRDLLDVGKRHRHLPHTPHAGTNPQAAVGHNVPAHLVIQPHQRVSKWQEHDKQRRKNQVKDHHVPDS